MVVKLIASERRLKYIFIVKTVCRVISRKVNSFRKKIEIAV